MSFLIRLMIAAVCSGLCIQAAEILPGSQPLTWTNDLSLRMHEAAHRDVERMIADSVQLRAKFWHRDFSSVEAYEQSIRTNRDDFKRIIGVVDQRLPVAMERAGEADGGEIIQDLGAFRAGRVRWAVFDGVYGEGWLIEPKGRIVGMVVAIPDADQTPESICGLDASGAGVPAEQQFARRLVENGFLVVVPTLIDRGTAWSGNPLVQMTNQPHREWIHRQAYMMGRHLIGYEVQKVLSAVDWFERRRASDSAIARAPIGVAGFGEGGLIAFYAAAVDPRIDGAMVSGYFKSRQETWKEPLYRNVWGLLKEFGDAEIGSLIAPRGLVIEYSQEPSVSGPPARAANQRDFAAPGVLTTPPAPGVQAEFQRIDSLVPANFQRRLLVMDEGGSPAKPGSQKAMAAFAGVLGIESAMPAQANPSPASFHTDAGFAVERQRRQVTELERQLQKLVQDSEHVRDRRFLYRIFPEYEKEPWTLQANFAARQPEPFIEAARPYRQEFWNEVIGKIDEPLPAPNPRSRKIYDEPKWEGYDVVLDVGGEGFAWGVLCLPKGIRPGEKRPVVVCQHGRNGVPKDVIEGDNAAYHNFAARLAEEGFITFAPHNLYRKEALYRMLSRKGNPVKLSMFSFIVRHHEQILNWLGTLPEVDTKRIAFYGLSYGGESAVRIPTLLEGYCLSICSGDFNDWTRKVACTDDRHSFMFTDEWEMPYFNMGNTFSYAELTYLMFPRPFMAERGHHDGVAPDQWVAHEFAKTSWLYAQFGMQDRTAIEFFNGGHTIHGQGTFEFLRKQLDWGK